MALQASACVPYPRGPDTSLVVREESLDLPTDVKVVDRAAEALIEDAPRIRALTDAADLAIPAIASYVQAADLDGARHPHVQQTHELIVDDVDPAAQFLEHGRDFCSRLLGFTFKLLARTR